MAYTLDQTIRLINELSEFPTALVCNALSALAAPSAIVVESVGSYRGRACVAGDGMAKLFKSAGAEELVTNGGVRDIEGMTGDVDGCTTVPPRYHDVIVSACKLQIQKELEAHLIYRRTDISIHEKRKLHLKNDEIFAAEFRTLFKK